MSLYFGDPWPSGICDGGTPVDTPVGEPCVHCDEPVQAGQQGSFVYVALEGLDVQRPAHKECSLRVVLGGIGHLENHPYWCNLVGDPDGGRSTRQSALEVWKWTQEPIT